MEDNAFIQCLLFYLISLTFIHIFHVFTWSFRRRTQTLYMYSPLQIWDRYWVIITKWKKFINYSYLLCWFTAQYYDHCVRSFLDWRHSPLASSDVEGDGWRRARQRHPSVDTACGSDYDTGNTCVCAHLHVCDSVCKECMEVHVYSCVLFHSFYLERSAGTGIVAHPPGPVLRSTLLKPKNKLTFENLFTASERAANDPLVSFFSQIYRWFTFRNLLFKKSFFLSWKRVVSKNLSIFSSYSISDEAIDGIYWKFHIM